MSQSAVRMLAFVAPPLLFGGIGVAVAFNKRLTPWNDPLESSVIVGGLACVGLLISVFLFQKTGSGGQTLTATSLGRFLTQMGYQWELHPTDGHKLYMIRIARMNLQGEFWVNLSPSSTNLWISIYLGKIALHSSDTVTNLMNLLGESGLNSRAFFAVRPPSSLYLYTSMENHDVTAVRFMAMFEEIIWLTANSRAIWIAACPPSAQDQKVDDEHRHSIRPI